ncbi:hypothetical protein [Micromonospora sp. NPDC004704]
MFGSTAARTILRTLAATVVAFAAVTVAPAPAQAEPYWCKDAYYNNGEPSGYGEICPKDPPVILP